MYATLNNHGICIVNRLLLLVTLASPHPSVENGNGFECDSDCHTQSKSKGLSHISFFTFLLNRRSVIAPINMTVLKLVALPVIALYWRIVQFLKNEISFVR